MLLSGDSVSASFGGYHASAGLGGTLDGGPAGGLFAEAGTPDGTGASAGLGGSVGSGGVLYSQAGVGGEAATGGAASSATSSAGTDNRLPRPTKRPADFYDNVFNIPISVLQAVNQLLGGTSKKGGAKEVHTRAYASSDSASSAYAGDDGHGSNTAPRRTFFDDIFNIPISALRSVNDLLNTKNQGERRSVRL